MIDYARARKNGPKLKAALTRAVNAGDPDKVKDACRKALIEWDAWGAWPDDWSRWQRALDDVLPWHAGLTLDELERTI